MCASVSQPPFLCFYKEGFSAGKTVTTTISLSISKEYRTVLPYAVAKISAPLLPFRAIEEQGVSRWYTPSSLLYRRQQAGIGFPAFAASSRYRVAMFR